MKKWGQRFYLGLIYGFLYLPLLVLIIYSFNNSKYSLAWEGFTMLWYQHLFDRPDLLQVTFNSLFIATLSATLATFIGTLAAVALYRYSFFGKKFLYTLIYIVMMSPEIVMGISLLILFISLGISLGFWTLLLAHVTFCLPYVIITVYGRMSGFNPTLIEAAKDIGAHELAIFRWIILPLLMPAVLAGWLLSFTLSMDDVIVSFFVTGATFQILPVKIYSMVKLGVKPEINALCTIIFFFTLVTILSVHYLLRNNKQAAFKQL